MLWYPSIHSFIHALVPDLMKVQGMPICTYFAIWYNGIIIWAKRATSCLFNICHPSPVPDFLKQMRSGCSSLYNLCSLSRVLALSEGPWLALLLQSTCSWLSVAKRPSCRGLLGVRFLIVCLLFLALGIRSWDIDLTLCNLDQQLKLFVSRHSATFSDIVKGKKLAEDLLLGGANQLPW